MKRKFPSTRGVYLTDILKSEAFWDLTATAIKVFMVFRMKCRITKNSAGKREIDNIANNGEIIFTFLEAWNNYGIDKSTFLRAIDKLIEVGLIEISEHGGQHHTNKYAISNNWMKYPEQKFTRPKSANLVGKKTRWTKDTVKNDTI